MKNRPNRSGKPQAAYDAMYKAALRVAKQHFPVDGRQDDKWQISFVLNDAVKDACYDVEMSKRK